MITPLPVEGWDQKPGCASLPFFGVQPVLITAEGKEIEGAAEGLLAVKAAWPSTIREVHNQQSISNRSAIDQQSIGNPLAIH